jgi:hypothetical protein
MLVTDIADLIVTGGFGTTSNTFKGQMPPDPDTCVVISEYGGSGAHHVFGTNAPDETPRVQVRVRGAAYDYVTPRQTIENIYQSFIVRGAFTVNNVRYQNLDAIAPPFPFDNDENKRWIFAVNFDVLKALSSST